ncbi:PREDICTED: amino acid permease 8-like [Nelumbo nucifera]|uniref:Amino acid permease 8-like n=1 Tax=Nelumbo nucifera TaxID=4432 RepID=A0A1U7ZHU9_NELNU|nr:PREDICTED: amino acid permease 8-like [Nelumbo nucifera]
MDLVHEDDHKRTGTVWTATVHAVTAVIGSGVLALPWSVAQIGWIFGTLVLVIFAVITYFTAILLCDCYRSPDPVNGTRNRTYMDVVRACLGKRDVFVCGIAQLIILWGTMIGYTVTAATSIMATKRSNCFHEKGHDAKCETSGNSYLIIFGGIEIILSQLPSLEKVTLLSVMAALMSLAYLFISMYLCMVKFASKPKFRGSLTGVKIGSKGITPATKVWHSFQALGNIAFAYTFSMLLVEIQDTLKSPPPENKTMKKASLYGLGITTFFYVSLGCLGYVAFGNDAPGNVLTGFYEPFWLVDIGNIAVLVHLIGAYQVYSQPIFHLYEQWLASKYPSAGFFHNVHTIRVPFTKARRIKFTQCKILLRTLFCGFTTFVAMVFPFFNAILGLLGSVAFWPLTVYFPISMYMQQAKVKRGSYKWVLLQSLSMFSLLVSLVAAVGSVAGMVDQLRHVELFSIRI